MATTLVEFRFAWFLIRIGILLFETRNSICFSLYDDLLPYTHGHGSSHSHRHIRDCQPVLHGNITYETWQANKHTGMPVADSKVFISYVPYTSRWVSGHITVVSDPLRTVTVMEPGGPGGCRMNRTARVEDTAKSGACLFAQNGGFFNTTSGKCFGNIVSDSVRVQDSGGVQNAQFGIRKDGSLVFGYLSEEDVLDEVNPFVQLVSGVVWLLRDGQVYINQSLEAECNKTQETGTLHHFVEVVSARTAVGHDAEGRLILFHIDGQTGQRGMNLWEVANYLKEHGVINAINMDGGGSSTYVLNGSLASYPSDHCKPNPMWRCPRDVSTILCVHQPRCQPIEDCSGHGACLEGLCQCQEGWSGKGCEALTCQAHYCGAHGVCTQYGCACDAGWTDGNCSQDSFSERVWKQAFSLKECAPGYFGDGCNQTCSCTNGGSCDPVRGRCTCPAGFIGDLCEQECPLGFYGQDCRQECRCKDMCPCDPATGNCSTSFQGKRNHTIHTAGNCLANKMFTTWRQEEESHKAKLYLSEQTWLIVTFLLTSLLLASVVGNVILARQGSVAMRLSHRQDYAYVPLTAGNGAGCHSGGEGMQLDNGEFELEETDFQD